MKNSTRLIILIAFLTTVFIYVYVNIFNVLSEKNKETTVHQSSKIALLKIKGRIDGKLAENITESLEKIKNNNFIKGVILEIDSGGGSVYFSCLIAENILELREKKFVIANIKSRALSGGYIIASASNYIITSNVSNIGNVGVFIKMNLVDSNFGNLYIFSNKFKVLSAYDPENNKEFKAIMQKNIDYMFREIKKIIAKGRKINIKKIDKEMERSLFYSPPDAKKKGLIDEIMPNNTKYKVSQWLLKKLGLKEVNLIEFK
jgi:protease-4